MAAQITLAYGATSITIMANVRPYAPSYRPRQQIGYAEGGGMKVADWGDEDEVYVLTFNNLSNTDYDSLVGFVRNTANFAANPITYTDAYAAAHTNMRIVDAELNLPETKYHKHAGSITLRKDISFA